MQFKDLVKIDEATKSSRDDLFKVGIAVFFIVGIMLYLAANPPPNGPSLLLTAAAMIGGYMALNIGANDVANNVGPAVGSHALTLVGAIIIAGVFESAGAIIAGGDVVGTIKNGIIDPKLIQDTNTFVWLMMAALLAGALWLNVATAIGAPVSTTHSIVGGVLGAGIAAGGPDIANWSQMLKIVSSWIISPVMGGIIAALFLFIIKRTITYQKQPLISAKFVVPLLIMFMAWAFSTYIIMKGLKNIWPMDFVSAAGIGAIFSICILIIVSPIITMIAKKLPEGKHSVNSLFTLPLIFSAALLSFAHGANDVANAVGPLAAINEAIIGGAIATKASIPLWIMVIGAIGITLGLALYGPRLIKTVGTEITSLNKSRAFCIAMAASITVIIASQLGLPVSSTHIAIGGIFGIGFLREYLKEKHNEKLESIRHLFSQKTQEELDDFIGEYKNAPLADQKKMYQDLKQSSSIQSMPHRQRRDLALMHKRILVKRSHLTRIVAAWIITVPFSGVLAAMIYFMLRGMMV